eukprot:1162013-Amphidinium_carterae.1
MTRQALAGRLRKEAPNPVRGVLHLAGVLDDALLPAMSRQHFERAYGPKVGWQAKCTSKCGKVYILQH